MIVEPMVTYLYSGGTYVKLASSLVYIYIIGLRSFFFFYFYFFYFYFFIFIVHRFMLHYTFLFSFFFFSFSSQSHHISNSFKTVFIPLLTQLQRILVVLV